MPPSSLQRPNKFDGYSFVFKRAMALNHIYLEDSLKLFERINITTGKNKLN